MGPDQFTPEDPANAPTHLLMPRGGAMCGRDHYYYITPEINDVTCNDCLAYHETLMNERERQDEGDEDHA